MLNRRNLRVKVLQTLYAYNMSDNKEVKLFEKALLNNVEQVYEMYVWTLNLLDEVAHYVVSDTESRANKFIPTEKDKHFTTKLNSNTFIESLRKNKEYIHLVKKYKVDWSYDPEIARSVFAKLKDSEEYLQYLKSDDRSISYEKDIVKFIFRQIILKNVEIEQAFEERFINWPVDKDVLKAMIAKTFKNFSSEVPSNNSLADLTPNWDEDRLFILELFVQTIRYETEYHHMISQKTQNWESERIALMDVLIMRMALTELEHFASIPIKVTMNEYIDLAKEFSTMKSNSFVNGILDKLLADMQKSGRINKYGRGLLN